MFSELTDMALELHELNVENGIDDGIVVKESEKDGILISKIEILNESGKKLLGKDDGIYVTIHVGEIWNRELNYIEKCCNVILEQLKSMICIDNKRFLLVGLGNDKILCDSIGPRVIDKILVTHHIKDIDKSLYENLLLSDVMAIAPGVLADTGIESFELVNAIVSLEKPDCVILIDALASRNINRLATTIQMSTNGLAPGSGVNNRRKEISYETLNVPVISIGVPLVVDASTLVYNVLGNNVSHSDKEDIISNYFKVNNNFFVSLKESDLIIKKLADLISRALNMALHQNVTKNDLNDLLN